MRTVFWLAVFTVFASAVSTVAVADYVNKHPSSLMASCMGQVARTCGWKPATATPQANCPAPCMVGAGEAVMPRDLYEDLRLPTLADLDQAAAEANQDACPKCRGLALGDTDMPTVLAGFQPGEPCQVPCSAACCPSHLAAVDPYCCEECVKDVQAGLNACFGVPCRLQAGCWNGQCVVCGELPCCAMVEELMQTVRDCLPEGTAVVNLVRIPACETLTVCPREVCPDEAARCPFDTEVQRTEHCPWCLPCGGTNTTFLGGLKCPDRVNVELDVRLDYQKHGCPQAALCPACPMATACRQAACCKETACQQACCHEAAEKSLDEKLATKVCVQFDGVPLCQALDQLRRLAGVNIVCDQLALEEEGVCTQAPVTMTLRDVSLRTALKLMLRNARATYTVEENVLVVTTERAALKMVRRMYPVKDLVAGGGEDKLITLITAMVEPQSWVDQGGQGCVDYYPQGMALVVRQSPEVHEQVQAMLDLLRGSSNANRPGTVRWEIQVDASADHPQGMTIHSPRMELGQGCLNQATVKLAAPCQVFHVRLFSEPGDKDQDAQPPRADELLQVVWPFGAAPATSAMSMGPLPQPEDLLLLWGPIVWLEPTSPEGLPMCLSELLCPNHALGCLRLLSQGLFAAEAVERPEEIECPDEAAPALRIEPVEVERKPLRRVLPPE